MHQVLQKMYDSKYGEDEAHMAASDDELEEFKDPLEVGDIGIAVADLNESVHSDASHEQVFRIPPVVRTIPEIGANASDEREPSVD